MIVSCPTCEARYQYDEARFGDSSTKNLKCAKCGAVFEVRRPTPTMTTTVEAMPPAVGARPDEATRQFNVKSLEEGGDQSALPELAPLDANRRYSLAVILGPSAGQIYSITKPRVVLGRGAGCDIQVQDSEVSRRHAMLEIHSDEATLTDLGSTNGTFLEGVRIQKAGIVSHQEFGIGTTTLMFIITEMHEIH